MIDTISLHINIEPPPEVKERTPEPFLWNDIVFTPTYTQKAFIRSYSGNFKNLFLTFNDSGLYLGNSWHKYYHGNNWNDYTFSEIVATYEALTDRFNGLIENAKVKRLDYGINLIADPAEIYGNWLYLRTKTPLPMNYKGTVYGRKFYGTEYSFKGYDKTFEIKKQDFITIQNQIIRLEKSISKMRNITHRKTDCIPIYTAKDLTNKDIIRQLGNDFLNTYQNIEQMENINILGLTATEKKIIAAMQNQSIREAMRKENPDTYRRDMKTYKDILKRQKTESRTFDLISEKMAILVNT